MKKIKKPALLTVLILAAIILTCCADAENASDQDGIDQENGSVTAADHDSGASGSTADTEITTDTGGYGSDADIDSIVERICQVNGDGTYVTDSVWQFRDELGNAMTVGTNPDALANDYDRSAFYVSIADGMGSYNGSGYQSEIGIDVSEYAGNINWSQVAAAGIQFAFLRIGHRGYTEGALSVDSRFEQNWEGAKANEIPVGVYFFSQAVSEEEAEEEADFVIETLNGRIPDLPVVYDPEKVSSDSARTADLGGRQFTANTIAFSQKIMQAGLVPAVYANAYMEATTFTMSAFNNLTIWYADFWPQPQSPYHFEYWQYEYQGSVPGFADDVDVDMDLHLIKAQ